jgi:hypothetical protein
MVIGFLVGVVASTISVLMIVRITRDKLVPQRLSHPAKRPQLASAAIYRKRPKARRTKAKSIRKVRLKPQLQIVETKLETPTVAPAQTVVSSCPACGLQAPEKLMTEHFMGSPSHQYGAVQPIETAVVNNVPEEAYDEEDSQNSVRSLLQMLVPPRAFGRRHAHRTVNPFSRIVETTRDSSHTSFRS